MASSGSGAKFASERERQQSADAVDDSGWNLLRAAVAGHHRLRIVEVAGAALTIGFEAVIVHLLRLEHTIGTCRASTDFLSENSQLAVFIDGPHHDADARRVKDADVSRRLDEAGYLVVRLPHDLAQWPAIFARHAGLFGKGSAVEA